MKQLGVQAKETLKAYVKEADGRLREWWDGELVKNFGFSKRQKQVVREMLEHAREHNLRSAKRLRGSLVHFGYQLSGNKADEQVWRAALAVEVVHTALLMHDDFMDQDRVRRGGPTTQWFYAQKAGGDRHFGEAMAVNVGDALLCLGFEELLSCGFEAKKVGRAMKQMLRGITNTAYGQAYDVTLEASKQWTEDDVLVLHRAKTGIYTYENPLLIGAILGELKDEVKAILTDYARDAGVAFQLQDDILGVFGNEESTGKSADSDLKQGKCTLLVLKALELADPEQKTKVEKVWGNEKASEEDLRQAKKVIEECGALEYSRQLAKKLAKQAAETAAKLRGWKLDEEAIDYIQGIAEYMVEREV